ncbi:MAG TPA: hypothetical protein VFG53_07465 [Anaeromyxobacter sp.]|nr:hypothetical protein [Anaeromyxobacter sp.]
MNREWTTEDCPDATTGTLRDEMRREVDELVSALEGEELASVARLAGRLLATARRTFDLEEERLSTADAKSLVRHAREHERFLEDLGTLVTLASRGDGEAVAALRADRFIPEWLAAHARTDRGLPA